MTQQSEGADSQAQHAEQAPTIAPAAFASAAKAFSKAQAEFERNRTKMQTALEGVKAAIGELESEKSEILAAPASREDFVEALCVEIDRRAEWGVHAIQMIVDGDLKRIERNARTERSYANSPHPYGRELWESELEPHARPGHINATDVSWGAIRSVIDGNHDAKVRHWLFNSIVSAETDSKAALSFAKFSVELLSLCFGEPMKDGLRRTFEKVKWPYPDAQSSPERIARLAAIDADLERLRAQEAELLEVLGGDSTEDA